MLLAALAVRMDSGTHLAAVAVDISTQSRGRRGSSRGGS
jgi:hypothetical protein